MPFRVIRLSAWQSSSDPSHGKCAGQDHRALDQRHYRSRDTGVYDEYSIYACLCSWGYGHKCVNHERGEFARDEDEEGLCAVHVNILVGVWSLLRSWLRQHWGILQEHLPVSLGCFEFVHNVRKRGKALFPTLIEFVVA